MSVLSLTLFGCLVQERIKATDRRYVIETEDLDDITLFIDSIDFKSMNIPTSDEIKDNDELKEKLFSELVKHTKYKRMPNGYVEDFKLKKFLSVEFIANSYINARGLDWETECEMVIRFLTDRVFEKIGF